MFNYVVNKIYDPTYVLYVTIVWSVSLKVIEDEDGRRWPAAPLAARE